LKIVEKSGYLSAKSKFIIVSSNCDTKTFGVILSFLSNVGLINTIVLGSCDGKFKIFSYNPYGKTKHMSMMNMKKKMLVKNVFSDKLKNLNGYSYKIIFRDEFPNIFTTTDKNKTFVEGKGIRFFEAIAKHQNARIGNLYTGRDNLTVIRNKFINAFLNRHVDLSLNTGIMIKQETGLINKVNYFENTGFCAMVPYPERKSFFSFVMEPFDLWTWILIMMSAVCFAISWHLLNKHSSIPNSNTAWYFLFAFVTFFIGQGVEFREHRLMQKVLIQLMILLTFIFGNLYQSLLISLMSEPRYGDQITSIQGMIDSNFTFMIDSIFSTLLNMSSQHNELKFKNIKVVEEIDLKFKSLAAEKIGFIFSCNVVDGLFRNTKSSYVINRAAVDYYYRIKDKFFTYYETFQIAPLSPFVDQLQDYSLRIHESGLKQHWHGILLNFEDIEAVKLRELKLHEDFLLSLEDVVGIFYCLGIGYALALMAFVLEIFYWDFMQRLKWNMVTAPIRRRFRSFSRRNRVAPHRIIQVQPRYEKVF
jgi:hypothetical protein